MKKIGITITLNLLVVLLVSGISCKNTVTPVQESEKENVNLVAVNSVKDNLVIEKTIGEEIENIVLPSFREGVAITWKSDNEAVIKNDGTVIHTPKKGPVKVKLTATFTKENEKAEKVFEVLVYNPSKTPDEIKVEKAASKLQIKTVFTKDENTINLPTSIEDVVITWVSKNTNVIKPELTENNVIHQEGNGSNIVFLYATLKKGNASVEKRFDVTVYDKGAVLKNNQILEAAKALIVIPVYSESENTISKTVTLAESVVVDSNSVPIEWKLKPGTAKQFQLVDNTLTMTRDVVDITGNIIATLSHNNETTEKEVAVVIPAYKMFGEADNYTEFKAGNILERYMKVGEGSSLFITGTRYLCKKIDTENNVISLAEQDTYDMQKGRWVSVSDKNAEALVTVQEGKPLGKKVEAEPTMENYLPVYNLIGRLIGVSVGIAPKEYTLDMLYEEIVNRGDFGENITTVEEAKKVSKAKEEEVVRKQLSEAKMMFGYDAGTPIDEMFGKMEAEALKPVPVKDYNYKINESSNGIYIEFNSKYNPSLKWYQQNGNYRTETNQTLNVEIKSFTYVKDNLSHPCTITFNEDYSSFKAVHDSDKSDGGTWYVTPNVAEESITVTNKNGITMVMKFDGDGL